VAQEPGRRATSRRQTLAATVGAAGIVQLPTAAIVVALPTLHAEFDASIAELQWTVTAFYIPETAFLIAAGRIADIFGRRLMLLIGAALFAAGALIAAAAGSAGVLIAGIAISGAGAALLMPASMSILTNVFTDARRGMAIGMWGAATELVSGVGVVVGGVLTGALSWRWIFIVCAAVVALVALAAWRGAPESRDPHASRKVDLPGVALLATAVTALTLALIQGAAWGWGSVAILALLAAAVTLFATFVIAERRASQPIISFEFFRRRNFAGATIVIFAIDFSFGALLFFLPLYFQEVLGYSPVEAGVLLLPLTGLMVAGSPLGGRVAARMGPRPPIVVGLALMASAVFWISTLTLDTAYADLWLPTAMVGFGIGFSLTPMNLAAMNAVSRHHAGAASGMLVTLSGLGATLGVAAPRRALQLAQCRSHRDAGDRGRGAGHRGPGAGARRGARRRARRPPGAGAHRRGRRSPGPARGARGVRLGARHEPQAGRRAGIREPAAHGGPDAPPGSGRRGGAPATGGGDLAPPGSASRGAQERVVACSSFGPSWA
jgi:EmrB/QacA subfamily drug resistance transporter